MSAWMDHLRRKQQRWLETWGDAALRDGRKEPMTLEDIVPAGTNRHVVTLRCPSCECTDHWGGYVSNVLKCTCGWYGRVGEAELELRNVLSLMDGMMMACGYGRPEGDK